MTQVSNQIETIQFPILSGDVDFSTNIKLVLSSDITKYLNDSKSIYLNNEASRYINQLSPKTTPTSISAKVIKNLHYYNNFLGIGPLFNIYNIKPDLQNLAVYLYTKIYDYFFGKDPNFNKDSKYLTLADINKVQHSTICAAIEFLITRELNLPSKYFNNLIKVAGLESFIPSDNAKVLAACGYFLSGTITTLKPSIDLEHEILFIDNNIDDTNRTKISDNEVRFILRDRNNDMCGEMFSNIDRTIFSTFITENIKNILLPLLTFNNIKPLQRSTQRFDFIVPNELVYKVLDTLRSKVKTITLESNLDSKLADNIISSLNEMNEKEKDKAKEDLVLSFIPITRAAYLIPIIPEIESLFSCKINTISINYLNKILNRSGKSIVYNSTFSKINTKKNKISNIVDRLYRLYGFVNNSIDNNITSSKLYTDRVVFTNPYSETNTNLLEYIKDLDNIDSSYNYFSNTHAPSIVTTNKTEIVMLEKNINSFLMTLPLEHKLYEEYNSRVKQYKNILISNSSIRRTIYNSTYLKDTNVAIITTSNLLYFLSNLFSIFDIISLSDHNNNYNGNFTDLIKKITDLSHNTLYLINSFYTKKNILPCNSRSFIDITSGGSYKTVSFNIRLPYNSFICEQNN